MVHLLTEELVAHGHDVTPFTSADSNTSLWDRATRLDGSVRNPDALAVILEKVRQRASESISAIRCAGKRGYTAIAFHRRRWNGEAEKT
jgi:hypothetical protein